MGEPISIAGSCECGGPLHDVPALFAERLRDRHCVHRLDFARSATACENERHREYRHSPEKAPDRDAVVDLARPAIVHRTDHDQVGNREQIEQPPLNVGLGQAGQLLQQTRVKAVEHGIFTGRI